MYFYSNNDDTLSQQNDKLMPFGSYITFRNKTKNEIRQKGYTLLYGT